VPALPAVPAVAGIGAVGAGIKNSGIFANPKDEKRKNAYISMSIEKEKTKKQLLFRKFVI
jgi:hypothetical protein